ncbi:phage portal protein [Rhizobium bangladeshense]|uniref:phage portal protein n=1 Tax=Rhizobium bangladeshense TaxID=1138189 RepID=UPI001C83A602|nr:phage portal protein [Rhizobium bangladeshense]MBX4894911.1 phage portal protein [Rhizobium bangladeshense]
MWPFTTKAALPVQAPIVEQKSLGDPTAELLELFGAIPAGTTISNAEALSVPAVSAAVRIISEAAASLDLKLKRKVDGAEEDVDSHPGLKLLTGQANGWTSGFELIRDLVAGALTKDTGALCYVTKVNGEPRELIIYRDGVITVDEDDKTGEPKYRIGGQFASSKNIMRVRGPFTKCPLSMARSAVSTASAMEAYANGLWTNGARPGGVIETPNKLGAEGVKAMLAGWKAAFGGKANAGKTAVLYEGATYKQMAITSVDGQFNESRVFGVLEIARAFRVPPGMLFELTRNTWGNSEQQAKEFIQYTLIPWLRILEAAFNRVLLSDEERVDHHFAFDIDDTSQADLTARATAISTLITARVLNPNEARDWLGMPPRNGGNEYANPAIDTARPANDNKPPKQETA